MEMGLLIRKHVTTLAIVVLALLGSSGIGRAQNDERLDKATNSTPNGSRQSQVNSLQDEIAKILPREVEDLRVFQPDTGTAVANYRLTSTPSGKKLATIVENGSAQIISSRIN